jgi:hypothetical protein
MRRGCQSRWVIGPDGDYGRRQRPDRPFDVAGRVEPGLVVAIDPEHPGQLRLAQEAYDRTVAGCVSGANGLNPGLVMAQEDSAADGAFPVALSGRVYCRVDATYGPIRPGDLPL